MTPIKVFDPHEELCNQSGIVLSYWEAQKGDRLAPRWSDDFRIEDLDPAIIPNMSVVDVIDGGTDYKYRFWGTNNTLRKGYEMTGKLISETPLPAAIENGCKQFEIVLKDKKPIAVAYLLEYKRHTPGEQFTYRFPLSSDGVNVDMIATYQDLAYRPENWESLFDELRVWTSAH